MKEFRKDFYHFVDMMRDKIPFAYARFSDGELRVLQNKHLVIAENQIVIGDHVNNNLHLKISSNEQKEYDPEKTPWVRDRLLEALQFKKENYYKGLSCRCCLSGKHGMTADEEFDWQISLTGLDKEDKHLTWSNLFLNGNYPLFLEHFLPYIWNYEVILVCNEQAKLSRVPFPIKKVFNVGTNCMVNDYGLVEEIKQYIDENNITGHLFLFSASTLSNFLSHQLFAHNDTNTYIDIGSTLNPYFGFPIDRRYLEGYWLGGNPVDLQKVCIW